MMTLEQLEQATGAKPANAKRFHKALVAAMDRFQINTPRRMAAFLATVSIESGRLSKTEEDLYYRDANRLADLYKRVFRSPVEASKYVANPVGLGQLLYKGYWGRGLIQLTWKENYQKAGDMLGFDYVKNPELVASAAHAALTAAWFWSHHGCNSAADAGDMAACTRAVNGPRMLHLKERTAQFETALKVFA